ncbi:putative ABC transport system ATP-binding protein [Oceanobacillus limi]|uniref:Putative ABC transport system ATP-binding protein n=1 Tax=Oceanobacillus limi TaxID=930131 RepID=A0A1I0CHP1_9BACI|nr:ABC transporter ATP-binding protein [Oceanobacillus limi]SET18931.1 putative ABC transport system ATP-binding protein [Oceanobacillus limi]
MSDFVLQLENISKVFHDGDHSIQVLKNINLSIKKGEFVAIVGPSGSGKSTLLSIIGALSTPTEGIILVDNQYIQSRSKEQLNHIRANKIGFVFQSANLIPYLNVYDQLQLINRLTKRKSTNHRSKELLHDLGLSHRLSNYPKELSGGEKQRVAIARAFTNNPAIILADEPTASLDSDRGKQVVEMIAQEVKTRNKAAIMVTHDERMLDLCDKVYRMEDGKLT